MEAAAVWKKMMEAEKVKAAVAVADNKKRKREDNKAKAAAAAAAKKVSDRAEKYRTAMEKLPESATDDSMEGKVTNVIVKCWLFIKDYNNDDGDYSPVKEMVRYLC